MWKSVHPHSNSSTVDNEWISYTHGQTTTKFLAFHSILVTGLSRKNMQSVVTKNKKNIRNQIKKVLKNDELCWPHQKNMEEEQQHEDNSKVKYKA